MHEKTQVLVTFQHYHVTQRLVVHSNLGNNTKSIKTKTKIIRPRPV